MRIEVRQADLGEGLPEDRAHRVGVGPMRAIEPRRMEFEVGSGLDACPWENRVFQAVGQFGPQVSQPFRHNALDLCPHWEEPRRKRLGSFRTDLTSILIHSATVQIDMLELERDDGPIARAGRYREGN